MPALATVSAALVARWYWRTPRAWPETLALLVHIGCWAAMIALLRYAPDSESMGGVFLGAMLGAGITAIAAAPQVLNDSACRANCRRRLID